MTTTTRLLYATLLMAAIFFGVTVGDREVFELSRAGEFFTIYSAADRLW